MAKAGRPTKLTPALLKKARQYLVSYDHDGSVIPTVAGLALYIGVCRDTCHAWANDHDKSEFSDILRKMLSAQEQLLLNKGLSGEFNSAITKLVLGKHGYHERVDSQQTGPDGGPVKVTVDYVKPDAGGS